MTSYASLGLGGGQLKRRMRAPESHKCCLFTSSARRCSSGRTLLTVSAAFKYVSSCSNFFLSLFCAVWEKHIHHPPGGSTESNVYINNKLKNVTIVQATISMVTVEDEVIMNLLRKRQKRKECCRRRRSVKPLKNFPPNSHNLSWKSSTIS